MGRKETPTEETEENNKAEKRNKKREKKNKQSGIGINSYILKLLLVSKELYTL